MEYLADQQLLALQGKGAKDVATRLIPGIDFKSMPFMFGTVATVAGDADNFNFPLRTDEHHSDEDFDIGLYQLFKYSLQNSFAEYHCCP